MTLDGVAQRDHAENDMLTLVDNMMDAMNFQKQSFSQSRTFDLFLA